MPPLTFLNCCPVCDTIRLNKPEERKLILKWLSPIAVSASPEDTPIVFHKVTE